MCVILPPLEEHLSLISVTFFCGAFSELALWTEHLSVNLVGWEPKASSLGVCQTAVPF